MNISSLRIKNFKKFSSFGLNFPGGFTLIIGENGSGKTSLLEAICVGLGEFLAGVDGVKPKRSIRNEEVRLEVSRTGQGSIEYLPQFSIEVDCKATLVTAVEGNPHEEFHWIRYKESFDGRTRRQGDDISLIARKIQRNQANSENLPLISYQSAGRLFSQKRERWVNPFKEEKTSRFVGYIGCLEEESDTKLMTHWFRRMKGLEMQEGVKIAEYQAVLSAVDRFMTEMEGEHWGGIDFDFFLEEIIIRLDDEWLPIRMLSAGYRGLIGMVTDLAYRSSVLNPHLLERSITETNGIVLIDELDLHLHPRWQWRVIDALRATFPRIQFIATTHAPILIASCIHGHIVNLGSDKLDNAPYGWRIEDVLREWMGTEVRDPEIERDIDELRNLFTKKLHHELNQDDKDRINNLTMKLNQILPESDPVITLTKLESLKSNL